MLITKLFNNFLYPRTSREDGGVIEINGGLEGTISKGREVVITSSGRFYGRVEARYVEIAGFVEGDVCAERLVIHSSGQLYFGKLNCQNVSIKDGGTIVNKSIKEDRKTNDVSDKGNPVNTSKLEYTQDSRVENNIHHGNKNLPDNQETKQLTDKTFAQEVKEPKSHNSCRQLHFYISY